MRTRLRRRSSREFSAIDRQSGIRLRFWLTASLSQKLVEPEKEGKKEEKDI
uniref:Uncharacterized protein n=1 Tax=Rhizophagus irregularis (strain DAOM 181602 / DAOM 197198 / MUCL 43194) TaxID=747089 RepID=U9TFD2_RHIID